jgi:hypothetical protein
MQSVVIIKTPIVGIRHTVFAFDTINDAYRFQDMLHRFYMPIETEVHETVGDPADVFATWNTN